MLTNLVVLVGLGLMLCGLGVAGSVLSNVGFAMVFGGLIARFWTPRV
jgi:mannose/fructose/N-acetylgalactosamine-specific phosphotransferase system component IIC